MLPLVLAALLKALTVGVDQMIRECWLEEIANETRLSGNPEHLRILKEGFRAALPKGADINSFGKGFSQMIFFAPFALGALEDRKP